MEISQNNVWGDNNFNVNQFGKQPRRLNDAIKQQIKENVPKNEKIFLIASMNDPEAFDFAKEIKIYLEGEGYITSGVNQALTMPPMRGQGAGRNKKGKYEIRIGTQV